MNSVRQQTVDWSVLESSTPRSQVVSNKFPLLPVSFRFPSAIQPSLARVVIMRRRRGFRSIARDFPLIYLIARQTCLSLSRGHRHTSRERPLASSTSFTCPAEPLKRRRRESLFTRGAALKVIRSY